MNITIIKNESEYENRLIEMEGLIDANPDEGTDNYERMLLLGLIIADYEDKIFGSVPESDPVDAIEFYMEQNGLENRDLITYIGSATRVSEIRNRKRDLSKQMIKALHKGLGIPAELLLRETQLEKIEYPELPVWQMKKRNYIIVESPQKAKANAAELVGAFFDKFSLKPELAQPHYRQTIAPERSNTEVNGLKAWQYIILAKAQFQTLPNSYDKEAIDDAFISQLRGLSALENGPRLAKEFLAQAGIHLVFEDHFERTRLDGAATSLPDGTPVIGMTLRHDRLDNFWYVLFHELAHVVLHLGQTVEGWYMDELDGNDNDNKEKEADNWAIEKLIPESTLRASDALFTKKAKDVRRLAKQERIHPSIIAGQIRKNSSNYRILTTLVGYKKVRKMFVEELKAITP